MRRAAPPRFASFCWPVLALCSATAAPGQSDRLRPLVDRALADLADPSLATDAARKLRNLGPGVVAPLCEALSDANRAQLPAEVRPAVIYLLAQLGKPSVPALPTLRALMRSDEALGEPAAAAISRMVPFLADETCQAIEGELRDKALARRYDAGFAPLRAALQLGPQPSEAQLRLALDGGHLTVAAVRWIAARAETLREGRDDLGAAVEALIEPLMVRPAIRWRTGATPLAPELATAQLALTNAPLDALTARALLEHQDADERRRAIGWLAENGAALPMRQRADLVGRLWDNDRAIAIAAAEAAGHWGLAGMVALPALRLMQASHEDAAVAAACRTAADHIASAGDRMPANDRAWLSALDAALRGDPAAAPARPCSRAGLELFGEMLYLAQWNDATSLSRVLSLFESAGPAPKDAIRAVIGWLPHENPRVADLACAWLTRRGLAAREAFGMGDGTGETDFAVFLRRACRYSMHQQAVRSGIEMLAHLLADGVWDANCAMLLDDVNSRVVAHALATAIAESRGTLRSEVRRLQTLIEAPNSKSMRLDDAAWDPRGLPVDLGNHVRTLAAIALSDLGVEFTPPPDLDDVVRQTIGIPIVDLRKHVEGLRESNRLPALLDRIEDQCRLMLCVPPHLRWPSLGGTTR